MKQWTAEEDAELHKLLVREEGKILQYLDTECEDTETLPICDCSVALEEALDEVQDLRDQRNAWAVCCVVAAACFLFTVLRMDGIL